MKIALIDDHELLRYGLHTTIDAFEGYSVICEADNGAHFIEQIKQSEQPDIIILDVTMPKMDGFETAVWIKENLPESKILVLSMIDNDNTIIRMLRHGIRGYLLKQCKPGELKLALDTIRDSGYFLNELINNRMFHYITKQGDSTASIYPSMHLSDREIQFLKCVCSENTYKEIAEELCVSPRTVDGYRDELFQKLQLKTRVGLAIFAIKNQIFPLT